MQKGIHETEINYSAEWHALEGEARGVFSRPFLSADRIAEAANDGRERRAVKEGWKKKKDFSNGAHTAGRPLGQAFGE